MDDDRVPAVGPRETYVLLNLGGAGNLMDSRLLSWLWKERSMVSSSSTLRSIKKLNLAEQFRNNPKDYRIV
jgi:hypothetical protein